MEGADIYQIAKNCRTSVEMIEKYYAAHIKNMINAAKVNVRRRKPFAVKSPKNQKNAWLLKSVIANWIRLLYMSKFSSAGVAELVDARDSKSRILWCVGSIPTTRTIDFTAIFLFF